MIIPDAFHAADGGGGRLLLRRFDVTTAAKLGDSIQGFGHGWVSTIQDGAAWPPVDNTDDGKAGCSPDDGVELGGD